MPEQKKHTFRHFHTGELKENLTVLILKLLNVWCNHTKLVDTCTEDVEGCVYLAFHLLLKSIYNILV